MFEDYTNPPPKAPYQLGDYAVIGSKIKYFSMQPKRSHTFIGQIGKVVGYKNVPGSYSKYLFEFDGGAKEAYMPSGVRGPFPSKEIASKYIDENIKIDVNDLRKTQLKIQRSTWQLDKKLEQNLKDLLTKKPFNFVWNDVPLNMDNEDIGTAKFLLGYHPDYKDLLQVIRYNRVNSKSLAKSGYDVILPRDVVAGYLSSSSNEKLIFQQLLHTFTPKKGTWNLEELFNPKTKHDFKVFVMNYDRIKEQKPLTKEGILFDFKQHAKGPNTYDFGYWITINLDRLEDLSTFEEATMSSCSIHVKKGTTPSTPDPLKGSPKKVMGYFNVSAPTDYELFTNFVLGSLKGGPEFVEDQYEVAGNIQLKSLDGVAEIIGREFKSETFNNDQYKEHIKFTNVRKKLPELEGIF
jgi:hypothetical protein